MKNKLIAIVCAGALLSFTSCGSADEKTESTQISLPTNTSGTSATTTTGNTNTALPVNSAPIINTGNVNPKHGEPGHRCDVAEGATFDSKAAQVTTAPPVTTPVITTSTPSSNTAPVTLQSSPTNTTVKSGAGLNPAHGQPGHRCEIAVGAPLDSKPIQGSISPVQEPAKTTAALPYTPLQPEVKTAATPSNKTAKGINPAHGQPGHRCDIAVGAPLDSKPTQTTNVQMPVSTTVTPAQKEAVKPSPDNKVQADLSKPKN